MLDRYDSIPERIRSLKRWVCALPDEKSPYCAFEGKRASTNDPFTWSTFEEAVNAVEQGFYSDIGFVFHKGDGLVGIDMDCGYDADGVIEESVCEVIARCRSYTERSRSGRGFHIILGGNIPESKGMNNYEGFEIYSTGRYFLLTADTLIYEEIRDDQSAIDWIVGKHFSKPSQKVSESRGASFGYKAQWEGVKGNRLSLKPSYAPIPQGGRHTSLVSYAGRLWRSGFSVADLESELKKVNRAACNPPLSDDEVRRIAESIGRYRR